MSRRLMPPHLAWLYFICFVYLFPVVVANAGMDNQRVEVQSFHGNSFAVYILSRGKGVPEEARTSFDNIYQELLSLQQSGEIVYLKKERIGLEGEQKVCAEFTDSENAREMFTRIHELAIKIDLFNVVDEACPR